MKTTKRFFAIVTASSMAILLAGYAVPAVTLAEDSTTQEEFNEVNSFRIGNQGYYFQILDADGDIVLDKNFLNNTITVKSIEIYKTDKLDQVKSLDYAQIQDFENGSADSWSYKGYEYKWSADENLTADLANTITRACVHLDDVDDITTFDTFPDGKLNVADVVFANQLRTAFVPSYIRTTKVTTEQIVEQIAQYDKVTININGNFVDFVPEGDEIPEELEDKFIDFASDNQIYSYTFVKSDTPIEYAYGYANQAVDIVGDTEEKGTEDVFYQILPPKYYKLLMSLAELPYGKLQYGEFDLIALSMKTQHNCVYSIASATAHRYHFPFTKESGAKSLASWYLVPLDDDENPVYKLAGGCKKLEKYLKKSDILLYDENCIMDEKNDDFVVPTKSSTTTSEQTTTITTTTTATVTTTVLADTNVKVSVSAKSVLYRAVEKAIKMVY